MKPFKKITIGRNVKDASWQLWISDKLIKKEKVDIRVDDFDQAIAMLRIKLSKCMPKRPWYYRVWVFNFNTGTSFRRLRLQRESLKSGDGLLLWEEAFELWCTYARML